MNARDPESPTDTARRERTEHVSACDRCAAGIDCPTADDLDARLLRAINDELPWSYDAVSTPA